MHMPSEPRRGSEVRIGKILSGQAKSHPEGSFMVKFFEKIGPRTERELEEIVRKHPDQIEDDLTYLDHQVTVGKGFMDVLCVDDKGVPVVIELKMGDDEGILMQALRYYDVVYRDRDRLARQYSPKAKFSLEEDPRIVLVAPRFSEEVMKAARYVKPEIRLLEYEYLKSKSGDKGLNVKEVPIEAEEGYSPPVPIEKIISYINPPNLRELCKQVVSEIIEVGEDIDEPRGAGEKNIRIRFRSRWLANIFTRRSFFVVEYKKGNYYYTQDISAKRDWTSNRDKIIKAVAKLYTELGGTPKE